MNFASATCQNLNLPLTPPPPSIPKNSLIPSNSKIPKATLSRSTLPTKTSTDTVRKTPSKNHYTTASPPYSDALDNDELTIQNNPVLHSEFLKPRKSSIHFTLEVNSVVDFSAYKDEVKQSLNRKHSYPKDNEKTPKLKKDYRTLQILRPQSQDKKKKIKKNHKQQ